MTERYYTTSTAFLEALAEAGIKHVFANLGSDHPGLIEALAHAKAEGRADELPQLIICPHETVALSAAHAYAALTHKPQAVIVHVDAGTQNMGGAISNAMRGRVPVLIFAGSAPYTMRGELPGSRNEFIHWIQDVRDQRGIMRGYVKYDNEIRSGKNVKQVVHRALQIAASEPAGPVYLVGAREVMEEPLEPHVVDAAAYRPVEPAALTQQVAGEIAAALAGARHPLIITGHLGRDPEAVPALVDARRPARHPRHRVGPVPGELPRRPPDAPRLAVHHAGAEPAARRGRRGPRRGQRHPVYQRPTTGRRRTRRSTWSTSTRSSTA